MNTHRHKCRSCNHIWEHPDECAGNEQAHTCSNCGTQTWVRHYDQDNSRHDEFMRDVKKLEALLIGIP